MRPAIRSVVICLAICIACAAAMYFHMKPWKSLLTFDDSYMFTRYARNFAEGRGISWNPDGVPTFGLTSIPWMFFVLPVSRILPSQQALQISSCAAAALALSAMAIGICLNAKTKAFRNPVLASLVALSLLPIPSFRFHVFTGMDTQLAIAANAILVAFLIRWQSKPSPNLGLWVGLAAYFAILVRMDSTLGALGAPLLAWFLSKERSRKEFFLMSGVPAILAGLTLIVYQLYFGTALPLSFFAKSAHAYSGFLSPESPRNYLWHFLSAAGLPLLLIAALATAKDLKRFAPYLITSFLTICYLFTVRQIMGFSGRFFFPQLPYLFVPALIIFDEGLAERFKNRFNRSYLYGLPIKIAAAATLIVIVVLSSRKLSRQIDAARDAAPHHLSTLAAVPWFNAIYTVTGIVNRSMPHGGVIASSEVGYPGDRLPNVAIVDLAGLNDTQIGLHGFSMDILLAKKPDLIWLPHTDYTGLRTTIFSDLRLYRDYLVIEDAFNYGIALRKDSVNRPALEKNLRHEWASLYAGTTIEQHILNSPPDFVLSSSQLPPSPRVPQKTLISHS